MMPRTLPAGSNLPHPSAPSPRCPPISPLISEEPIDTAPGGQGADPGADARHFILPLAEDFPEATGVKHGISVSLHKICANPPPKPDVWVFTFDAAGRVLAPQPGLGGQGSGYRPMEPWFNLPRDDSMVSAIAESAKDQLVPSPRDDSMVFHFCGTAKDQLVHPPMDNRRFQKLLNRLLAARARAATGRGWRPRGCLLGCCAWA